MVEMDGVCSPADFSFFGVAWKKTSILSKVFIGYALVFSYLLIWAMHEGNFVSVLKSDECVSRA